MTSGQGHYYIPEGSPWPIVATLGVLLLTSGAALLINDVGGGGVFIIIGLLTMAFLFYSWFNDVIHESMAGYYNEEVDKSFRQGMIWFIGSEVFFFMAFFGSLFYIRVISGPWLGGEGWLGLSNMLHEGFKFAWPLVSQPEDVVQAAGAVEKYMDVKEPMGAWGVPALNTILLLSSGATVTWAHWGLKKRDRRQLVLGLFLTVALGLTFVAAQAYEYGHAYHELGLTLNSGIYGSLFFMLTGFHGFHVIIGAIMLTVILLRAMKGHFSPEHHFAFEAVAWYWHFVDVVWLGLFTFVYLL